MNRSTRIFLYGLVLLGISILIFQSGDPDVGPPATIFGLAGLLISGYAAFKPDS